MESKGRGVIGSFEGNPWLARIRSLLREETRESRMKREKRMDSCSARSGNRQSRMLQIEPLCEQIVSNEKVDEFYL